MERFKSLFGIDRDTVRKTVLLLPFIPPRTLETLGIKTLSSGLVFSAASSENLTVIKTGTGAGFVGDAVMYLAGAPCQDIIFLGSCGLINRKLGLGIGSLITPSATFSMESFSDILSGRLQEPVSVHPDSGLLNDFIEVTGLEIQRSGCISFGSLFHEDAFMPVFRRLGVDVIEMECAALFNAARKTGKRALALLYVSDILGEKNFYFELSPEDKKSLANGVSQASQAILKFAAQN
jgi:purine-nucleoside phosphorylase